MGPRPRERRGGKRRRRRAEWGKVGCVCVLVTGSWDSNTRKLQVRRDAWSKLPHGLPASTSQHVTVASLTVVRRSEVEVSEVQRRNVACPGIHRVRTRLRAGPAIDEHDRPRVHIGGRTQLACQGPNTERRSTNFLITSPESPPPSPSPQLAAQHVRVRQPIATPQHRLTSNIAAHLCLLVGSCQRSP